MKIVKLILLVFLFQFALLTVNAKETNRKDDNLKKPNFDEDKFSILYINRWTNWASKDGRLSINPSGASGGCFPIDGTGVIYTDGLVWGGKVSNEPNIRVGGQTYNSGTVPGHWGSDHSDESTRIYRIKKGFNKLHREDFRREAMIYFLYGSLGEVRDEDFDNLIAQYENDWENWPVELGAPYIDKNKNGTYDGPDIDEPGIKNADQVIWFVVTDEDSTLTDALYGSPPIGLEIQVTMWAYKSPVESWREQSELSDITFRRYILINKSENQIDSMYISFFGDSDIGDYGDDYVGCSEERNLAFGYNATESDHDFYAYGLKPAAVGFDLLQGPLVYTGNPEDTAIVNFKYKTGYRNLSMTSFGYFSSGSSIPDPEQGEYEGTLQWYNLLQGYLPSNDINNPTPYQHGSGPDAGENTKFPLNGNPVSFTGDLDGEGSNFSPGDRKLVISSGPFTMMPGDSQEIVLAVAGGYSYNGHIQSVNEMFKNDSIAQLLYDNQFSFIPGNVSHNTKFIDEDISRVNFIVELEKANSLKLILKNTDEIVIDSLFLFDDGLHNDELSNDGIWSNNWETIPIAEGLKGDLIITSESNDQFKFKNKFEHITTGGPLIISKFKITKDYINNDRKPNPGEYVEYEIDLKNNGNQSFNSVYVDLTSIISDDETFIIDASSLLGCDIESHSVFEWENGSQITPGKFTVPDQIIGDDYIHLVFELKDNSYNIWYDSITVYSPKLQPLKFEIKQNYPNPFNGITTIDFIYPSTEPVEAKLEIFNILGQNIKTERKNTFNQGINTFTWDGKNDYNKNVPTGIYFCRINTGRYNGYIKILYMK